MYSEIRGISIKQVLWKILFGWKYWIVAGIVCAALLFGFKYKSVNDAYSKEVNKKVELEEEEIKGLEAFLMLYDRLHYYEQYYEDTILLKIDTEEYDILEVQYYIDTNYIMNYEEDITKDYTASLVSAYSVYILSSEYSDELRKEAKLDASVSSVRELTQVYTDKEGATFKLVISVPNGCEPSELEAAVDKIVLGKKEDFMTIGEHEIEKINSSVNRIFSDSLEKLIYTAKSNMINVRRNIESSKLYLSDEEKQYIYENIAYDEYRDEFKPEKIRKPGIDIKFAIVGFLLGVFGVCAIYMLREVFSDKLQNENDISSLYKIDKIGTVKETVDMKKKFIIDRILLKIKNRKHINCENIDVKKYLVSKVELICKQSEIKQVLFVNTGVNEKHLDAIEYICAELKKNDIKCEIVNNIMNDSQELIKVNDVKNVIIISKINESYYSIIDEEIGLMKQCNANLLGNIVIE